MTFLLQFFILIPLVGFIFSLLIPAKKEDLISWVAFFTVGSQFVGFLIFVVLWLLDNHPTLDLKDFVVFKTAGYEFFIDFYFDKITAVYLFFVAFLTFLVTIYSRYYMHRENGYKSFFNT